MRFSCPFCCENFGRKEHLDRHKQRHAGSKPFTCQSCSKSFSRRYTILFLPIMCNGSDINNGKETLFYAIMSYMIGVGRTTQAEMAGNPLLVYHVLDLNCAAPAPCLAIVARQKTSLANIPPQNADQCPEGIHIILNRFLYSE